METAGSKTAASRLLDSCLRPSEAVVLFTTEGLSDSKAVTALTDRSMVEHAATVASGATVRYLVCYAEAATRDATVPPHLASRHRFAQAESDGKAPSSAPSQLGLFTVDVRPENLSMPSRRLATLIHREDPAVEEVRGAADLIQRGVGGCDVDRAARSAAAWLSQTLSSLDGEYDSAIASVFEQYRTLAHVAQRSSQPPSMALSVVEATLRRYTALVDLLDTVSAADGPFAVVMNAGRTANTVGTDAQSALSQRLAALATAASHARAEAWALMPLVRPLMALRFFNAATEQTIGPIAVELAEAIAISAALSAAIAPRDGAIVNTAFFERVLSLAAADVVAQVEGLLALPGGVFLPKESGASPSADVPAVDSALAPGCLAAAKLSAFEDCAIALDRWVDAVRRAAAVLLAEDLKLHAEHVRFQPRQGHSGAAGTQELPGSSAATWAAHRIRDLVTLIHRIRKDGCGLLPPPTMTLFSTIHHAATQFPLLSPHQYRNWAKFTDTVERTFVLKYTEVNADVLYNEFVETIAAPPGTSNTEAGAAFQVLRHGGDGPRGDGEHDEEKALLRSRVVTLAVELTDCRRLVKDVEARLQVAELAAAKARAEAESLRAELGMVRRQLQSPADEVVTAAVEAAERRSSTDQAD
jgi:hypothetical protein